MDTLRDLSIVPDHRLRVADSGFGATVRVKKGESVLLVPSSFANVLESYRAKTASLAIVFLRAVPESIAHELSITETELSKKTSELLKLIHAHVDQRLLEDKKPESMGFGALIK